MRMPCQESGICKAMELSWTVADKAGMVGRNGSQGPVVESRREVGFSKKVEGGACRIMLQSA